MEVKEGTLWSGSNGKTFRVLSVVKIEENTWVHYRDQLRSPNDEECKEYSCFIESFVSRFTRLPD